MKYYYVYLLESIENDNLYIGYTTDLVKRLREHNNGLNTSTKPYRPWRVIYYEACLNEDDAKRREKYLKTNQGARLIKRRVKEYFYFKKNSN
ncbi:MAG: GIY-YIG nuclease family protein [bacterium]|nr:GIY-YIG nuclease family protein [bacterium]